MALSNAQRRHAATQYARMQWVLLAKLVAMYKYDDGTGQQRHEMNRLQHKYEQLAATLQPWHRTERMLRKHTVEPATRILNRKGLLQIAADLLDMKRSGRWVP